MLKVPSCEQCNGRKSQADNSLRDYLTIDIDSSEHPIARELFLTKTTKAAKTNRVRLLDEFFSGSNVPVFTQDGLFDGIAYGVEIDEELVNSAVVWLTRGLHWAVFGNTVKPTSTQVILVDRYARLDTVVKMATIGWTGHYSQGEPFTSAWIVTISGSVYWAHIFFDTVLFFATTRNAVKTTSDR